MLISELELFEALSRKIGSDNARTLVKYVEAKVEKKFDDSKDVLLTKHNKIELIEKMNRYKVDILRTVYTVGLVQFIAIVGSVLAIVKFVMR